MFDTTATTSTISTPTVSSSGRSTTSHCFSRCHSRTHSSAASTKDSLSDSPDGETEATNKIFDLHSCRSDTPISQHVHSNNKIDQPSLNDEGSVNPHTPNERELNEIHHVSQVTTRTVDHLPDWAHSRPGLVADPRGGIFASSEIDPESNKHKFKLPSRSPSPNSPRLSARNERQGLSTNVVELVDFFATEPAPLTSDDQEIPAAFVALADGKKYIGLKDVASRGLGWRHPERVLDSDLDHFTEVTAPPRFRKPLPRALGGDSPVHCQSGARQGLWSNLKYAFCFTNRKSMPRRSPRTHLHHATSKRESGMDARTSQSGSSFNV
ncbi:hypothetical protein K440DRAFT_674423 [Wilcoxina mikolae CBS 423.85]|nr:hypothetical protein K440DRAFT_674423 [Wilcoxina mikolae CBS 423.85]